MAWSEKVELIISCGIPLHGAGVSNWALSKEQALDALNKFEAQRISVLGGDVYKLINGEPESNYDSWYCERESNEPFEDFVSRSIKKARTYIINYNSPNQQQELFVFVAE
jgi:hypothetical protein